MGYYHSKTDNPKLITTKIRKYKVFSIPVKTQVIIITGSTLSLEFFTLQTWIHLQEGFILEMGVRSTNGVLKIVNTICQENGKIERDRWDWHGCADSGLRKVHYDEGIARSERTSIRVDIQGTSFVLTVDGHILGVYDVNSCINAINIGLEVLPNSNNTLDFDLIYH
uniref:18.9 kDa protein n=1 Tax=Tenuivirus oryzabrevis TaxID=3052762 RepID=E0WGU2_9VIRU|nr:hypothetical protein [Tenuivirus oryzabrevis]CBM40418.1 18.9 kDa protein [Tenuivirus oryzabrevis]